jgi:MFS family permease
VTEAAAPAAEPRARLLAFLGVFGAGLLSLTALGATMPVLPRYVTGPLGAGSVAVGVTIGAFAIGAVLARPFAGRVADARGRRIVLVSGAAVMCGAHALFFLPMGVLGLVGVRLLVGMGEALIFTAGATWVVDLAPSDRRAQSIGVFGLSVWTGLSLGTVAGEGLFALGGFGAVWAFAALAPLLGALIAARVPEPRRPPQPAGERTELVPRAALRPGVALALASAGYATMASFVVLHLAESGAGSGAAVFTVFTAAVVAARLLGGRLPDRIGARPCAIVAGIAEASGLALVAVAGSTVVALGGALAMGVGFSLLYPALALMVVDGVEESRRGAALGTFTAFFDIGLGLGAPLAGAVAALAGLPAAFVAAAVLSGVGALVARSGASPREGVSGTVGSRSAMPGPLLRRAPDSRP